MKFVVFAVMAALTVMTAGCCRTNKCAPACAPAPQMQRPMAPPPYMPPPPTLEK